MSAADGVTRQLRGAQAAVARAASATAARVRGRPATAAPAEAAPLVTPSDLHVRRDRLARQLAELQWDLGGLTYEMAIRDHFRLEVLMRMAARLQEVDGELAEIDRLLHLDEAGAGGNCPACAALHARGAPFCWRCGTALLAPRPVSSA